MVLQALKESWIMFTPVEKRNIAIYIVGIMLYKFGLEAFNGSIVALATNKYDYEAWLTDSTPRTFERVGLLTGLNQAFQCVGSILIAPLIKRWPTKLVLACAVMVFGVMTAILLIVDAGTGGRFKPDNWDDNHDEDDFGYYGNYNANGIIPIYCVSGIAYGMVELIRRVIPRDIVGGNVQKLRRMDSLVHIFYEISGTAGAFCTALALIPSFGNNYSFIITPIFFTAAACVWFFVTNLNYSKPLQEKGGNYLVAVGMGFFLFFESIWTGFKIIFSSRRFIWLLPGYSFALYGHRYLENGIAPAVARRYLGNSAWSQIMVGGSNFGELLGAGFVFLFTNLVQTPMPWLRLDSLMLLIVWYLPYWYPVRGDVNEAWRVAGTFIPISFGWAAGDVSLAAFIQASLARLEAENTEVSALGAVMAFLYSTYIVIYAVCSPLLGRYIDSVYASTGGSDGGDIHRAIRNVGGVQFTVLMAVVLASTFIPKGALSFNPKMLNDEVLDKDLDHDSGSEAEFAGMNEKERRQSIVQMKMDEQAEGRRQSVTRVSADINDTFSPDMHNIREEDGGLVK
ncbi:hypothetical protein G647_03708 [Cladophialophora carrionii CBS 160.54]|uniref:Major facilitator superfamily (MFS) profile domain-containing protein n=1 Tax=Cladophialophora carrionii CBS 160.54 TaxID=1279043 RepID=V9DBP6_9EURO|nr:uncharacterized protein G647_03708 [Cladophialophora carrionii CBS 160.54]ETI24339.1 hypothetical protein G647_03708 [Cladophialophora carrionii CBS 160.54]